MIFPRGWPPVFESSSLVNHGPSKANKDFLKTAKQRMLYIYPLSLTALLRSISKVLCRQSVTTFKPINHLNSPHRRSTICVLASLPGSPTFSSFRTLCAVIKAFVAYYLRNYTHLEPPPANISCSSISGVNVAWAPSTRG
jgi:hypothetical protein